jgi:HEAT repeat protein
MARRRRSYEAILDQVMDIEPPVTVEVVPELLSLMAELSDVEDEVEDAYEMIEGFMLEIGEAGIPTLIGEVQHKEPEVRAAALTLLSMIGQPGNKTIIEAAKTAFRDRHSMVRESALYALCIVADESAIDPLLEAAESGEIDFLMVTGLAGTQSPRAVTVLARTLYLPDRKGVRDYVINALKYIGTPEVLQAIQDWQQSVKGQDAE